jgi:hypothetical protein
MFTKTKVALSVALILSAATAALANDSGENHQDEDRSVVSRSVADGAFGFAGTSIHKQRPMHAQSQSR